MVLPLASRFSVLSVDDDDDNSSKKNAKSLKKKQDNKLPANQPTKPKQEPKKKSIKKVESQPNLNQQTKAKNKPSASQRRKKAAAVDQWESWKEKDEQLLDGHYESELHQAILLSQLDYEEKKDLYEQLRKEQEVEKKNANTKKKKGNKTQTTMSLSEFNNLADGLVKQQEEGGGDTDVTENGLPESDPEFFERIRQDAKKVFSNEQAAEKKKAREPLINDAITIAQFEDQIERRDKEILDLKKEITRLKEELRNVKTRNKTLCQILGQGEMRDKAEVLVQMEKTQKVKDELSNEVQRLHALLEQERSKVHTLTSEKNKGGKNKKRTASENQ